VGYWIGYKAGPPIFNRPSSRFFKADHLQAAKAFFDLHGGKTIIIARFMPFIRTFAPVVAGAARMEYKRFLLFNVVGGVGWVFSMILLGYTLHIWLDPLLKPIFGENFQVAKHIDKVVILIVLASVAPLAWKWWSHRKIAKNAKLPGPPMPTV
jgi:membrane-associated protein